MFKPKVPNKNWKCLFRQSQQIFQMIQLQGFNYAEQSK
jgi:hypothetical protein